MHSTASNLEIIDIKSEVAFLPINSVQKKSPHERSIKLTPNPFLSCETETR